MDNIIIDNIRICVNRFFRQCDASVTFQTGTKFEAFFARFSRKSRILRQKSHLAAIIKLRIVGMGFLSVTTRALGRACITCQSIQSSSVHPGPAACTALRFFTGQRDDSLQSPGARGQLWFFYRAERWQRDDRERAER